MFHGTLIENPSYIWNHTIQSNYIIRKEYFYWRENKMRKNRSNPKWYRKFCFEKGALCIFTEFIAFITPAAYKNPFFQRWTNKDEYKIVLRCFHWNVRAICSSQNFLLWVKAYRLSVFLASNRTVDYMSFCNNFSTIVTFVKVEWKRLDWVKQGFSTKCVW